MFKVRRNDRETKRLRARLREASKRFKDQAELLNFVEKPNATTATTTVTTTATTTVTTVNSNVPVVATTLTTIITNRLPPISPMLAGVLDVKRLNDNDCQRYLCEEKFDGERLLAVVPLNTTVDVRAFLYSRALKRQADSLFPHEIRLKPDTRHDCMLDGELVWLDPKTDRPVAICDTGRRACLRVEYRVFDVLYIDGHPVYCRPLEERKRLLAELLVETEHVRLARYRSIENVSNLWAMFDEVVIENGGEGLILKRKGEGYRPGERAWLKMKPLHIEDRREEFDLQLHRLLPDKNGVGNVLECGYDDDDNVDGGRTFRVVCRTSSGINSTVRHQLRMLTDDRGYFVRPTIATIVADKITEQRRSLRHPVFHRLRLDLERVDVDPRLMKK